MVTITSGVVSDNALGDDAMGTTRLLILAANEGRRDNREMKPPEIESTNYPYEYHEYEYTAFTFPGSRDPY